MLFTIHAKKLLKEKHFDIQDTWFIHDAVKIICDIAIVELAIEIVLVLLAIAILIS